MKPLIVGSPEAMSKEPSLDPPDEPRNVRKPKRKLLRDYPKDERLDQFFKEYVDFDEVFNDSKGG